MSLDEFGDFEMQVGEARLAFRNGSPIAPRSSCEGVQVFPESHMVTIVFADDTTTDFEGTENYHKARHACLDHPQPDSRQVS